MADFLRRLIERRRARRRDHLDAIVVSMLAERGELGIAEVAWETKMGRNAFRVGESFRRLEAAGRVTARRVPHEDGGGYRLFKLVQLGPAAPGRETYGGEDVRVIEDRWRQHNVEARAAGCPCGRPAEAVTRYGGNTGSVPVEFWTCAEHKGAEGWSGRQALFSHPVPCPAGDVRARKGPIGGDWTEFLCPHREHPEEEPA